MNPNADAAERTDASLIAALAEIHYQPLWDRYQRITPLAPSASDGAFHWPWREIEKLTGRAGVEVGLEDAERRAVIMCHPAFNGEIATTSNLISAFTLLEPGALTIIYPSGNEWAEEAIAYDQLEEVEVRGPAA